MATTAITLSNDSIETGVEALSLAPHHPPSPPATTLPTLPGTLTPAPVTVIRSGAGTAQRSFVAGPAPGPAPSSALPPAQQGSFVQQPLGMPPSYTSAPFTASPLHPVPAPLSASPLSTLPGAGTAALPVRNHTHLPQQSALPSATEGSPKFGATVSGLPAAPPTISLPSLPPTISLGPIPTLPQTH